MYQAVIVVSFLFDGQILTKENIIESIPYRNRGVHMDILHDGTHIGFQLTVYLTS